MRLLAYGAVVVVVAAVGLYFAVDHLIAGAPPDCSQATELRAAIVDHLSESAGNETFVNRSTALLEGAGYAVDYYESESVTVDFYRNLPTHCYSVILLRVHSASFNPEEPVFDLFTSEPYSQSKYVSEQLSDRLRACAFDTQEHPYVEGVSPVYFGVTHEFVRASMRGQFHDAVVVMMGCDGMKYEDMADAFVEKGAEVYIGWDRLVSASHTDSTTVAMLERFLVRGQTVEEAVAGVANDFGADPAYGSVLSYYPSSAGNCTAQDLAGCLDGTAP